MTGRGGDFIIIDDPIKPEEAYSDSTRKKTNDWFQSTLFSRLDDKKRSVMIIVMQRLHVNDLTGFAQESGKYPLRPAGDQGGHVELGCFIHHVGVNPDFFRHLLRGRSRFEQGFQVPQAAENIGPGLNWPQARCFCLETGGKLTPRAVLGSIEDQLAGWAETETRQTVRDAALANCPDGTTDDDRRQPMCDSSFWTLREAAAETWQFIDFSGLNSISVKPSYLC